MGLDVLNRFEWSVGVDEDVHLAGAEVVAVNEAVCIQEVCLKQILHRDERIKVGLRVNWPLKNEDAIHMCLPRVWGGRRPSWIRF